MARYSNLISDEEARQYREERAAKKAAEEAERQKTQEAKDREAAKAKRQELETSLKARFLANGASEAEWLRHKDRIVTDAMIRATLEPDPEPEPAVVADAPLPKSRYRN